METACSVCGSGLLWRENSGCALLWEGSPGSLREAVQQQVAEHYYVGSVTRSPSHFELAHACDVTWWVHAVSILQVRKYDDGYCSQSANDSSAAKSRSLCCR